MIRGDGIGPETSDAATPVLLAAADAAGLGIDLRRVEAGDSALEGYGEALPADSFEAVKNSDACLKAPVGESAADVIVALRRRLDLYANLRPAIAYPGTPALHPEIDLLVVRENTEDLYTGKEIDLGDSAVALRQVSKKASARIARRALEAARGRKKLATCVHKANVMRVSDGLFAKVCEAEASRYPDVKFEHMYVDACAMDLVRRPERFDIILTTNMFGDILSDEASQAAGGLGMAPAANVGDSYGLFEPVHGAAFDIAGRGAANPCSLILASAMMLEWLAGQKSDAKCTEAASRIRSAVTSMAASGKKTRDVGGSMSTAEFASEAARLVSDQ